MEFSFQAEHVITNWFCNCMLFVQLITTERYIQLQDVHGPDWWSMEQLRLIEERITNKFNAWGRKLIGFIC
jgi:hypothetical protein